MRGVLLCFLILPVVVGCRLQSDRSYLEATPVEVVEGRSSQSYNPNSPWYRESAEKTWYFDGFVGAELAPDYVGSDDYETEPELDLRVLYVDPWENRHSLSLGQWNSSFDLTEDTVLQLKFEYEEGRESDDNDALTGLDDQDATVELQATLGYRFGDFSIAAVAQPDLLGRGKGFVGFVALGYDRVLLDERLRVAAVLDVSLGDGTHMDNEFGIERAEAATTAYAHYEPGGGWKSSTFGVEAEYFVTDGWSVLLGTEMEYYFDKAADTPLIDDEGSRFGFEGFLGVRYRF
ncbi:MAG: MipA/OmpV family protein [Planctomycetota bacterium]